MNEDERARQVPKEKFKDDDSYVEYKERVDDSGLVRIVVEVDGMPEDDEDSEFENGLYDVFVRPEGATIQPQFYVVLARETARRDFTFRSLHIDARSANMAVETLAKAFQGGATTRMDGYGLLSAVSKRGKSMVATVHREWVMNLVKGYKLEDEPLSDEWESQEDSDGERIVVAREGAHCEEPWETDIRGWEPLYRQKPRPGFTRMNTARKSTRPTELP